MIHRGVQIALDLSQQRLSPGSIFTPIESGEHFHTTESEEHFHIALRGALSHSRVQEAFFTSESEEHFYTTQSPSPGSISHHRVRKHFHTTDFRDQKNFRSPKLLVGTNGTNNSPPFPGHRCRQAPSSPSP